MKLKTVKQQVIAITGASSGIGLATAKMAAEQGARVFLISRDESALGQICARIREKGGQAAFAVADVADVQTLQIAADLCADTFGGIDTWVNNAGVSVYGKTEDVPLEDMRRLFDTNYWGTVHGSLIALPYLRRSGGGSLINIGSVESDIAFPLTSAYTASKHAVKAFTQALRMELEKEGAPINVSVVKPATIDTPFFEHAKNYMGREVEAPAPRYEPEVVATNILYAATHKIGDITVGGNGKRYTLMGALLPRLTETMFKAQGFAMQQGKPVDGVIPGSLDAPSAPIGATQGKYVSRVRSTSAFTALSRHRIAAAAALVVLGATLITGLVRQA